jgi:hypothetical protein
VLAVGLGGVYVFQFRLPDPPPGSLAGIRRPADPAPEWAVAVVRAVRRVRLPLLLPIITMLVLAADASVLGATLAGLPAWLLLGMLGASLPPTVGAAGLSYEVARSWPPMLTVRLRAFIGQRLSFVDNTRQTPADRRVSLVDELVE